MLAHLPHIGRKQEVAGAAVNKDAIYVVFQPMGPM